jgi:hypothetical protein
MLIDPYLNEGLIRDRNLLRLTAQGGATQMATIEALSAMNTLID